jgi:hypothetical protein
VQVETLRCDECGKLRVNDSNHWLEGATYDHVGGVVIVARLGEAFKGQESF